LQHPEHKSFALHLAETWIELAERDERKQHAQNAPLERRLQM
jgi:hypothetical protein